MSELRFQLGDRVRISGTAIKTHTGYSPLKTLFREGPVPVKRDSWLKSTSLTEGVIVGYRTVTDGITHYDSDGACFVPTEGTSRRVWLVAIDLRRNPVMAFDSQLEKAADGNAEDAIARVRSLADWHETKADKARRFPGDPSRVAVMLKAAEVHEDAARRILLALDGEG